MAEKRQRCRPQTKLTLGVCIAEKSKRLRPRTKLTLGVFAWQRRDRDAGHRPNSPLESAWQRRDRDAKLTCGVLDLAESGLELGHQRLQFLFFLHHFYVGDVFLFLFFGPADVHEKREHQQACNHSQ